MPTTTVLVSGKYAELEASHHLVPVAIETTGVCGPEALQFLCELGPSLKTETGEPHSLQFLFQRISVPMQRGNAAAVLGTIKGNQFDYNDFNFTMTCMRAQETMPLFLYYCMF